MKFTAYPKLQQNWNNKPKKRKQTLKLSLFQRLSPCFWSSHHMERVPLHVLTNAGPHHTETEQSPTRAYTAKFTRAAFTVASLSPPGWEKIDRWTFLKARLEGKHLSCMGNELRAKQEWHPTQFLNYHQSNISCITFLKCSFQHSSTFPVLPISLGFSFPLQ